MNDSFDIAAPTGASLPHRAAEVVEVDEASMDVSSSGERKETLYAVLFCVFGTALFFRGPLFSPRLYHIPYDLEDYHQPLTELIASSLRETRSLPWWNPYSYMGESFSGNVQAAVLYPVTLLIAVLGNVLFGRVTLWLMTLQLALHVALAGVGTYVLLRMLKTTFSSALAGAAIYQLGAFFASQTQHLGAIAEAGWLPWFLAALHQLQERGSWRSAALAAVTLSLMLLPGFPAAYLPLLVFVPVLYGFWLWQRPSLFAWRPVVRSTLMLVAALLAGVLLSAVSWLPGYQVSQHSVATLRPPEQSLEGLPLAAATSLCWPNLLGQLRGEPWLPGNRTFLHIYQGVPAVLLVFGSLVWLARSPRSRPFLVAAIIAALWMFGKPFVLARLFYLLLPGFVRRGIYPDFALAYFCLFFAVLAAFAFDGWERGELPKLIGQRLSLCILLLALVVLLLSSVAAALAPADSSLPSRVNAAGGALLLVTLVFALCASILGSGISSWDHVRGKACAAICVLIVADLVLIGSHSQLNTSEWPGDVEPPAVEFLRARLGPKPLYRIDTTDAGYSWQTKVPQYRLPSANGLNPLLLLDTVEYRRPFSRLDDRQFVLNSAESPLFDLAGIRYIVTRRDNIPGARSVYCGPDVNVFENPRAFPRFFLVGAVAGVGSVLEAFQKIQNGQVDPSKVVLVARANLPLFAALGGAAVPEDPGRVDLLSFSPNEFRVRVTATRPAAFVAIETYTRDWLATVDGHPSPVVRADGLFRATPVPEGTHEIHMFIRPRMLYIGATMSCGGLVLIALWLLLPVAKRKNAHDGREAAE